MMSRRNKIIIIAVTAALLVLGGTLRTASAQKASVPRPQNRLVLGEEPVKQLLLLMETNPQGKVSKQEYMKFMEAEFERLDTAKKGELDVKQVAHTNLTASRYTGK